MKSKSKILLIIGGTGFFGKSILKFFLNSKYLHKKFKKIIILSRNKKNNFEDITKLKKFFIVNKINCNILNVKKLPFADYVIYAASLKSFKYDYLAIKNYTKLAKVYHSQSKILFTSSGAVYGIQSSKNKGFKENCLKLKKKKNYKNSYKKSYGKFKLMSEKLFQRLGSSGINVSIARCFAFVGEFLPLNSNFVIGNLIQCVLKNSKITLKANHQIYRSYMYSDDLVRFLLKVVENSNIHCPIYNIGSSDIISVNKIVEYLAIKYSLSINAPKISKNKSDIYFPNIDKIINELKIKYRYSSVQSINKTIKALSYKKKLN